MENKNKKKLKLPIMNTNVGRKKKIKLKPSIMNSNRDRKKEEKQFKKIYYTKLDEATEKYKHRTTTMYKNLRYIETLREKKRKVNVKGNVEDKFNKNIFVPLEEWAKELKEYTEKNLVEPLENLLKEYSDLEKLLKEYSDCEINNDMENKNIVLQKEKKHIEIDYKKRQVGVYKDTSSNTNTNCETNSSVEETKNNQNLTKLEQTTHIKIECKDKENDSAELQDFKKRIFDMVDKEIEKDKLKREMYKSAEKRIRLLCNNYKPLPEEKLIKKNKDDKISLVNRLYRKQKLHYKLQNIEDETKFRIKEDKRKRKIII